jgi:hypothetical protein
MKPSLVDPDAAARELARVAAPGASVAIYLYEDFVERSQPLHAALAAANALRVVTTRLSPKTLMRLCRIGSAALLADAGLQVTAVGNDRGWMVAARTSALL